MANNTKFSFIQGNLLRDEKIILAVRPHGIIYGLSAFLFVFSFVMSIYLKNSVGLFSTFYLFGMPLYKIVALVIFLIGIIYGIKSIIMHQTSEYGITNKRIIMKTGLLQRQSVELFLEKVEAIYVDQSILGRLLNYGNVIIVGTGSTQDTFYYVPNPLGFRTCAQQQVDYDEQSRKRS